MTKTRKRMHRIFDAWLIYVVIMVIAAFVLMLLAYQQGAQFTDWEAVQHGGATYNGWETALLMRLEALLCLYTAVFSAFINFFGFRWLYDRKSAGLVVGFMIGLGIVSAGYFVYGIVGVGTFEPVSLINISFMLVTLLTMSAVAKERPTLRKVKVSRTVVK